MCPKCLKVVHSYCVVDGICKICVEAEKAEQNEEEEDDEWMNKKILNYNTLVTKAVIIMSDFLDVKQILK